MNSRLYNREVSAHHRAAAVRYQCVSIRWLVPHEPYLGDTVLSARLPWEIPLDPTVERAVNDNLSHRWALLFSPPNAFVGRGNAEPDSCITG